MCRCPERWATGKTSLLRVFNRGFFNGQYFRSGWFYGSGETTQQENQGGGGSSRRFKRIFKRRQLPKQAELVIQYVAEKQVERNAVIIEDTTLLVKELVYEFVKRNLEYQQIYGEILQEIRNAAIDEEISQLVAIKVRKDKQRRLNEELLFLML